MIASDSRTDLLRTSSLAALLLFCSWLPSVKGAVILDLFSTGVNASGTPLADGTIGDPHYTITSAPAGSTDIRVRTSAGGFPIGPWLGDNGTSAWVGPNNSSALNSPPGTYTFETSFTLPAAYQAGSAVISGGWATDNPGVDILLNGNSLVASGDLGASELSGGFGGFTSFSFGPGVPFFNAGTNALSFQFQNAGSSANPAGLRVDNLRGTFAVPEPSTPLLLLFCGITLFGRRRRKLNH